MNKILDLFSSSRKIDSVNLYSLVPDILTWRFSRKYATEASLPEAITFDSNFWSRVQEIHKFTLTDGHERAVTLWWVDGDYVLTQNIIGSESKVNIPAQKLKVSYEPTGKNDYVLKRVVCNGKQLLKVMVARNKIPKEGMIKISNLFNMHTHPIGGNGNYGWFSDVDIKSFLKSSTAITGMISDRLWLLVKTKNTKNLEDFEKLSGCNSGNSADKIFQPTPEFVRDGLNIKIYRADFGKSAVNYLN